MRKAVVVRALLIVLLLTLFAPSPTRAARVTDIAPTCEDTYEPDDQWESAHELTGPERHRFFKPFASDDHDWSWFRVKAGWIYQIKATAEQWPTAPKLQLYDAKRNLLAENDHYFGKDAEIWWWNNGDDQQLHLLATETRQLTGCDFYYTVEVIPWSPDEFQLRFGNQ